VEWLITLPGLEDIINADVIPSLFIYETLVSPKKDSSISNQKGRAIYNCIRNGATFIHETLIGHETICKR
jgi:hypothetical protein